MSDNLDLPDRLTNKRSETRIECNKPVSIQMFDKTTITVTALNYSMGGIGIMGSVYQIIPQIGEKLSVFFTLGSDDKKKLTIIGTVKHIHLDGARYYLGLGI